MLVAFIIVAAAAVCVLAARNWSPHRWLLALLTTIDGGDGWIRPRSGGGRYTATVVVQRRKTTTFNLDTSATIGPGGARRYYYRVVRAILLSDSFGSLQKMRTFYLLHATF
uniref:Putative secreted protein n=1 Tax=Anopheles darlingi TaxID=43151 RepID=A0A2M4DP01_ANODA